jgi:hypothetical protein
LRSNRTAPATRHESPNISGKNVSPPVNGRLWFGPVVVVNRTDVGDEGGGAVVDSGAVVVVTTCW